MPWKRPIVLCVCAFGPNRRRCADLDTSGTDSGHRNKYGLGPILNFGDLWHRFWTLNRYGLRSILNLGDLWRRFGHQRSMAVDTWDASGAPKLRRAYVMLAKFVADEGCRSHWEGLALLGLTWLGLAMTGLAWPSLA